MVYNFCIYLVYIFFHTTAILYLIFKGYITVRSNVDMGTLSVMEMRLNWRSVL